MSHAEVLGSSSLSPHRFLPVLNSCIAINRFRIGDLDSEGQSLLFRHAWQRTDCIGHG